MIDPMLNAVARERKRKAAEMKAEAIGNPVKVEASVPEAVAVKVQVSMPQKNDETTLSEHASIPEVIPEKAASTGVLPSMVSPVPPVQQVCAQADQAVSPVTEQDMAAVTEQVMEQVIEVHSNPTASHVELNEVQADTVKDEIKEDEEMSAVTTEESIVNDMVTNAAEEFPGAAEEPAVVTDAKSEKIDAVNPHSDVQESVPDEAAEHDASMRNHSDGQEQQTHDLSLLHHGT